MTKREKRLLFLIVVSLHVAAANFIYTHWIKPKLASFSAEVSLTQAQHTARAIVPEVLTIQRRHWLPLEIAHRSVRRDAFAWYEPEQPAETVLVPVIYTGFVTLGGQPTAILNGDPYQTGESVRETGERVVRVTPDVVTLYADTTDTTRELPFRMPSVEPDAKTGGALESAPDTLNVHAQDAPPAAEAKPSVSARKVSTAEGAPSAPPAD